MAFSFKSKTILITGANDRLGKLRTTITNAFDDCFESKEKLDVSLRMGAYAVAVEKVVEAEKT